MRVGVGMVAVVLGMAVVGAVRAAGGGQEGGNGAHGEGVFSRKVKGFDFEEREQGNFEAVPMYWSKLVGRGYPAYAGGRFDTTVWRSSNDSFRLDIDGGSVAYRFTPGKGPGRIAVTPDGDYVILAFVKTTALAYAKADLAVWYADEEGKLLPETEAHAMPWAGTGKEGKDDWHVLHVFVHGPAAGSKARSMLLQVGLLQPQQLAEAGLSGVGKKGDGLPAKFELYQQDITGTAWFDDITVFQLPRLSVSVPAAATIAPLGGADGGGGSVNVFPAGGDVALDMAVSDISRDGGNGAPKGLGVMLTVSDAQGLVFAREQWQAVPTPEHPWSKAYRHAALPAGIYTATLDIMEGGAGEGAKGLIARRQTRFVMLGAQEPARAPAAEFGLSAAHWPTARWGALEPLARETGVGMVEAPAWREDLPEGSGGGGVRDVGPFDALTAALARDRIGVVASLESLPASVSARLRAASAGAATQPGDKAGEKVGETAVGPGGSSLLGLATADPGLWRPSISFLLARHANGVAFWQVAEHPAAGMSDDLAAASGELGARGAGEGAGFAALYAKARAEIGPLLSNPRLVIPWNGLYDFDGKSYPGAVLNLRLPATIKPDQLPTYITSFKAASNGGGEAGAGAGGPILVHIDTLPADGVYGREDRLADVAKRVVFARSANPTCVLLDVPFVEHRATTALGDIDAPAAEPDELLPAYRTLVHALGGASSVKELRLARGVRAFLCKRGEDSSLVLWNEAAETATVTLDLPLGAQAREVALSGESHGVKAAAGAGGEAGLARLEVGTMPVIVEGVSPGLLELRSSFALGAQVFPAGAGSMETEVTLTNPGPEALRGLLHLEPPRGWTVEPTEVRLSLLAGETLHEKVRVRYPFTEPEGVKAFGGRLIGENGERALVLSTPVSVRSKLVAVDGFCELQANGDLVVQQMITNTASTALNAQAYALVPGYPRQQRFVTDLQPGQTLIKRYVFAASAFTGEDSGEGGVAGSADARVIAAALKGKEGTLGVRQTDGKTLLAKGIPLE